MKSKHGFLLVMISAIAVGLSIGSPASAAFLDDGLTREDFTRNGVFDQEGYTAALITFQTAPIVSIDAPIKLSVKDCAAGSTLSAEFVGFPASKVTVVSVGSPTTITLTPPKGIATGFNVIRLTCSPAQPAAAISGLMRPQTAHLDANRATATASPVVRDVIVNLQPTGTPGVTTSLTVSVLATTGAGGGLPRTGSDERTILGIAAATLLLGGAVTLGTRRRFATSQ